MQSSLYIQSCKEPVPHTKQTIQHSIVRIEIRKTPTGDQSQRTEMASQRGGNDVSTGIRCIYTSSYGLIDESSIVNHLGCM
jgi:hypothetical protein